MSESEAKRPRPGAVKPDDRAVASAATELSKVVRGEFPKRFYPSESDWRSYGAAMIARIDDVVESSVLMMEHRRVMDGAALVRVLYEHVVRFCWIAIDPETNLRLLGEDALLWERRLHTYLAEYDEGFLTPDELSRSRGYRTLESPRDLAGEADRHWEAKKLTGFVSDEISAVGKHTLRYWYSPLYQTLSEPVHGNPQGLRANMTFDVPRRVSIGDLKVANQFWWPLIVTLYAKALFVCAHRFRWPDAEQVRLIHNGMYHQPT